MTTDHRLSAKSAVEKLLGTLRNDPNVAQLQTLAAECESLASAIAAFHIEAIRFRMFNVDRLLTRGGLPVPAEAPAIFADVRHELEAAGFHTRSHAAPTSGS
jgi:hypothetical protein